MSYLNPSSDLGKKIIEAYSKDFIGDVIFDDDETADIKNYLAEEYRRAGDNVRSYVFFKQSLIVLLVNNAKKWGDSDDDRYFEQQNLKDIFDDENLRWNDFNIIPFYERERKWLLDNRGRTHRYKQTILYNAFSPKRSIEAFIDLIFNVLTDPINVKSGFFDNTFDEYPDDYLRFVERINSHFLDSEISDSEDIVNLYNNSYKLTAAMRHGFQYDQQNIARLTSRTVSYIKKHISKENISDGTYYSELVKKRLSQVRILVNEATKEFIKAEKVRSINDWYAYYSWSHDAKPRVVIKMPILKLQSKEQYKNLKLCLYLNDRLVLTKAIEIYGEDYNPHLRSIEIDISNHLRGEANFYNFRINILDEGNLIFDTKEKLFRSFMVFSLSSEREINNVFLKIKNDYVAIFPKNNATVFNKEDTVDDARFFTAFGLNAFELIPKEGDYIEFTGKRVIFSESDRDPSLNVECIEIPYIKYQTPQETLLPVYRSIESMVLTPSLKTITASTITAEVVRIDINTGDKSTEKLYFNVSGDRNKTINVLTSEYPIFNSSGYFLVAFFVADKKIAQLECLVGNYELRFEDKYPNKSGIHQGYFYENGTQIINDSFDQCDKVFYVEKEYGNIVCSIPYLEYKLVGRPNSSLTYLYKNKKEIFYIDELLDLSNIKLEIETSHHGDIYLMVGDKRIERSGSFFDLSSVISKQTISKNVQFFLFLNNHSYEFINIYTRESIIDDGANLVFDSDSGSFFYNLEGFVGEAYPVFQITIYDDEGANFESPVLYGTSGDFKIDGFVDGLYYFKVKRISDEDKMDGAYLYKHEKDYLEFGDCNRVQYSDMRFALTKCKNSKKQKVTFHEYFIDSFEFLGYQTFPVFKASLYKKKAKITSNVFVLLKEKTLVLYTKFENEELTKPVYFNSDNDISLEAKNGYEPLKSVYYEEED